MTGLKHAVRAAQVEPMSRPFVFGMVGQVGLVQVVGAKYSASVPSHMHRYSSEQVDKRTVFQEHVLRMRMGVSKLRTLAGHPLVASTKCDRLRNRTENHPQVLGHYLS